MILSVRARVLRREAPRRFRSARRSRGAIAPGLALALLLVWVPRPVPAEQPPVPAKESEPVDRLTEVEDQLAQVKAGRDAADKQIEMTDAEKKEKVSSLESQKTRLEQDAKQANAAGADQPSASKNVSIVAGAVVLNPFKLSRSDDPNDPNDPVAYRLDTGSTDANFLVEVGFRRRWAWLDFVPVTEARERASQLDAQIEKLDVKVSARKETMKTADAADVAKQDEELANLKQERRQLGLRFGTLLGEPAKKLLPESFFGPCDLYHQKGGWKLLVPDDWTVRLGFAAGSSTPSGAAALAGAGDFYIEAGFGWNLARFTLDDTAVTDGGLGFLSAPIRGAFSLEGITTWNNDPDLNDIHQRWFGGASVSLGVPISVRERKLAEPVRVWEVMIRIGAAGVEIPDYLNSSTNEVKVRNQLPDFLESKIGVGLDAELNVPVSIGYLTFRGTMNSGFDPNPWTATVGYTLPLSGIVDIVTGGSRKSQPGS